MWGARYKGLYKEGGIDILIGGIVCLMKRWEGWGNSCGNNKIEMIKNTVNPYNNSITTTKDNSSPKNRPTSAHSSP